MDVKYRVHFLNGDWQPWMANGDVAGTIGQSQAIDLIEVSSEDIGMAVRVHSADIGWMDPVAGGQTAGVTGQRIEAVMIGLTGEKASAYESLYRTHVQDYGWLNWTRDGAMSGTEGGGLRLEALQVYIAEKGALFFDTNQSYPYLKIERPIDVPQVQSDGLSEDQKRMAVVQVSETYLGYRAEGNNQTVFANNAGIPGAEWCHLSVNAAFDAAGLSNLILHTAYCPDGVEWFLKHPTAYFYRRNAYTPRAGDVIYFDNNQNGTADHVGLVVGVSNGNVITREGNTYPQNGPRTGNTGYYQKSYPLNSAGILGYGVPDYSC